MWDGPVATAYGSTSHGIIGGGNHIALFPSKEQGAAAAFALWASKGYMGMRLDDAINKWTGGTGGSSQVAAYMHSVGVAGGITADTRITKDFIGSAAGLAFMKQQAALEAGGKYPLSDEQWKRAQDKWRGKSEGKPINITYNVTNHISGDGLHHQIAELHRKHIEQMRKDLEEVNYRHERSRLSWSHLPPQDLEAIFILADTVVCFAQSTGMLERLIIEEAEGKITKAEFAEKVRNEARKMVARFGRTRVSRWHHGSDSRVPTRISSAFQSQEQGQTVLCVCRAF